MISFYQALKINALYEMKILLRGWFFRIFAIGSILTLAGMDVLFHSTVSPVPRFFHALDSFLPYMNIAMPHFLLIIVVVFLATDLYKRDKKFNTSDVIYIRDMSNLSFVLGRISGILTLFLALDFIYLLIAAVINLFFSDLHFVWQAYFIYPFLLSLPALIFVVGLTMFLMHIIRNQAVVIVLVLGLLIASVFYFGDFGFLTLDILAAKLPFTYSDFTGLSNFSIIVSQRTGWFLLGLILMLLSILLFERLPQSKKAKLFITLSLILLPLLCASSFYNYYNYYNQGQELRNKVYRQLSIFSNNKNVHIKKYVLDVRHQGNQIFVQAKLSFENLSGQSIDTLKLLLNPGLKIENIRQMDKELAFKHDGVVVTIELPGKLKTKQSDSLQISYSGSIDDRVAYPQIYGEERIQAHYIWLFRIEPRYAFTEADYLLLPPSVYWYPKTNPANQRDILKPFADFLLSVETADNLTVISQGKVHSKGPGKFEFINGTPLKEISLIAGRYLKQTVQVDSLDVSVYSLRQHDYYKRFFKEIGDTLPDVIKNILQDFENKIGLCYPFQRLTFVEIPIQMYAYQRNGRLNADFLQAEQVWLPENLATLSSAYFKHQERRQKRFGNRSNQTFTDLEKEIMLLKRFANNTFTGAGGFGVGGEDEIISFAPDLNIYPLFMNFSLELRARDNQGFAIALEANLRQSASFQEPRKRWLVGGLTGAEEANLALANMSLDAILKGTDVELINKVLVAKGSYLLKKIKNILGGPGFDDFMQGIVENNRFKPVSVDSIADMLYSGYNFDLDDELKKWRFSDSLAGYLIKGFESYQIRDGDRLRYQILFSVYNPTPIHGLIEVGFSYPGEGRGRFMEAATTDVEQWLYWIKAGTAQQIGIILDSAPRAIRVNTLLSQNLPAIYSFIFDDAELMKNKKSIEGQFKINWLDDFTKESAIIDNSSKDFEYAHPQYHSQLKEWIHKEANTGEKEYKGFSWWRGPSQWQKLKFPSFYGEFVHSAYYARSGSGERKATWITDIPDDGLYLVFVHVPDQSDFRSGRRGRGSNFGVQKYTIHHLDGEDEIEIDFSEAEAGWNYLETYYFKEGPAKIVLTDDSDGRMVIADAVKWELKE